jgi:DNA-binding beta-propeller fold protein YncE
MRGRALLLIVAAASVSLGGGAPDEKQPGRERDSTLLPNGWRIAPAGRHLAVGDLPLSVLQSPDGCCAVVSTGGFDTPTLTVVDIERMLVRQSLEPGNAWLGLAWSPDGKRLYSSAGGDNAVDVLLWEGRKLKKEKRITLGEKLEKSFLAGLDVSPDGRRLFVVNPLAATLSAVDLEAGRLLKTVTVPAEPYTCRMTRDGKTLLVSLWGGSKVLLVDPETLAIRGEVPVGEHPSAMALSPDGARLFVACANTNAVWVVDLASRSAIERISIALEPKAPAGSTPNGLGLSADGRTLLVANADNNTVALVDVDVASKESRVKGFLPVGWYPTGAQFTSDGKRVLVISGKGLLSQANPRGPQPADEGSEGQYIAALIAGAFSAIDTPTDAELDAYTKKVHELTPYRDAHRLTPASPPKESPIPRRVGDASPIKHVFYVVRENRTYDQILGDVPMGDGDPALCLFGEEVTPNAHALAKEFVLFDNFYVDAEVSHDGHAWSTGAYATDVTEKIWPTLYAGRGGQYLSEGGGPNRNPYGNVTAPAAGYIWDACARAGVSYRTYGEFAVPQTDPVLDAAGKPPYEGSVPGLRGHVAPDYPPYDLSITDNTRIDAWLEEFRRFEKDGNLPRFSILRLGNDHTAGTRPGMPTPRAMIADNDRALGRLVEAISKSRYWKESAIFVVEDDAQNGPDHVDAHRSVLLVASPYARRGALDSELYTTSGVLRTIELILGLEPLSQYDAAATPMYGAFQTAPDTRPFAALPARVPLDEKNRPDAWGSEASMRMNLEEADRAPDLLLNEIVWRSVRGADSPMPAPMRASWVRPLEEHEEDEEEED